MSAAKSLKDLALKETPVTIVLRASVELKLTTRKTVETVKRCAAARGRSTEDEVLGPRDSIGATCEDSKCPEPEPPLHGEGRSWKPGPTHRRGWSWPGQAGQKVY